MEQLLKVEGYKDLAKDPNSKAIVNTNRSAYENAVKRAKDAQRQRDELRDAVREINSLKCEMQEMKSLLLKLVDKD
jgi:hypothetical protein